MGLAAALAAMSDEELEVLLTARSDLTRPPLTSFAELATRAARAGSIQQAFVHLDSFARQVLDGCCLLSDGARAEDIAALMRTPDGGAVSVDTVVAGLDRLRAFAIVIGDNDSIRLPGQSRELVRYPAGLGRPLAVLLAHRPASDVDTACKLLGTPARGTKAARIAAVAAVLSDPQRLRGILAGAPREARAIFEDVDWGLPVFKMPGDYWYYRPAGRRTWVDWLVDRVLLVPAEFMQGEVPREVGLALRDGVAIRSAQPEPVELRWTDGDVAAADNEAGARAAAAVRAVAAMVSAWGKAPAAALQAGGLGVRELRKAAKVADVSEMAARRLLEVASSAGLVTIRAERAGRHYVPTPDFDAWLEAGPGQQWTTLASAWMSMEADPSSPTRSEKGGRPGPALIPWQTDAAPRHRRAAVLRQLRALPEAASPDPPTIFGAAVWQAGAVFDSEGEAAYEQAATVLAEAALLGVTGHGGLSTAGRLVLEGLPKEAAAAAARLLPKPSREITLQADFTCVAPGALEPTVAANLALMAGVESTGAATMYRFTETSLRRAFDAGRTAADVHQFLTAHAVKGVPQALAYLVSDSYRRHGQVRAGSVQSYVRAEDPALVAQVLRIKRAAKLGLRQLAPGVIVSSAPVSELIDVLRAGGFSAVEEDEQGGMVITAPAEQRAPRVTTPYGAPIPSAQAEDMATVVRRLRAAQPPSEDRAEQEPVQAMVRREARRPSRQRAEDRVAPLAEHVVSLLYAHSEELPVRTVFHDGRGWRDDVAVVEKIESDGGLRLGLRDGTSVRLRPDDIESVSPLEEEDLW